MPAEDRSGALPVSFGYKCAWLAVKVDRPEPVAAALSLESVRPAHWKDGIQAAYEGRVFVSPALSGWVLAASTVFPESGDVRHSDRCTPWLLRVGGDFPEVQFFCTHRVVEYHAWAKIVAGKVIRKYAYIGEQGLTVWNDGPPTAEELSLDLNFSKSSDVANLRFPDEEAVMQLAGAWSLNPSVIESYDFAPGMGLLGSMPVEDTTIRSPQVSWLQRFRRLLPCGK
jgi:hypothetical protein